MRRDLCLLGMVCLLLIASACSSVSVKRVKYDPVRINGEDGFPFFISRPCIAVKRPFVVDGDFGIVNAYLTPDGKHVYIPELPTDSPLKKYFSKSIPVPVELPVNNVEKKQKQPTAQQQSDQVPIDPKARKQETEQNQDPGTADNSSTDKPKPTPATDKDSVKIDYSLSPLVPVNTYYDMIYIKDPKLYYLVKKNPGLGSIKLEMVLGPGGSLRGYNAEVNNDSLKDIMIGLIKDYSQRLLDQMLPLETVERETGSEEGVIVKLHPDELVKKNYTPVSLKIEVLRVVPPAIYPVHWDAEIADNTIEGISTNDPKLFVVPIISVQGKARPFLVFKTYPLLRTSIIGIQKQESEQRADDRTPPFNKEAFQVHIKNNLAACVLGKHHYNISVKEFNIDRPKLVITYKASVGKTEDKMKKDIGACYMEMLNKMLGDQNTALKTKYSLKDDSLELKKEQ